MDSYFFKPVKKPESKKSSMDEALTPDDAPAGTAPIAVLFGFLPKFVQNFISLGVQILQKILNYIGEVIWQAMKGEAKDKLPAKKSMNEPIEGYSQHASFDHVRRIENVEQELAGMRGGFVNKTFKLNMEQRLQKIERQVGLRPAGNK